MGEFRVIVCGGRDYDNEEFVWKVLDCLFKEGLVIIQGGARGADSFAKNWAENHDVENREFEADWNRYGRAAGHKRNTKMLEEDPHVVVAFPGGPGTENMVNQAHARGVLVLDLRMEEA